VSVFLHSGGIFDVPAAQKTVNQANAVKRKLHPFIGLEQRTAELPELISLAKEFQDAESAQEAASEFTAITQELDAFEIITLLDKPNDSSSCYLTVNSGAGGTEACDWAEMLL